MAIKRLGAQRFSGLEVDVPSLPIDADLLGAIFDSTDTLEFWIFDGTAWQKAASGGGTATFQPAYQFAVTPDDLTVTTPIDVDNVWRLPIDFTSLASMSAYVEEAPTGSSITVLVKKNGSEEATIIIGTGSKTGSTSTFITGILQPADEITIEIKNVGTTTPGSNLKVSIIDGAQSSTKSIQFAVSTILTDLSVGLVSDVWRTPTLITTMTEINAYVQIAPVGSPLILDVLKDGTPIGTISIADGAFTGSTAVTDSLDTTEEVTIDITQVGSTTTGQNLKVNLLGT